MNVPARRGNGVIACGPRVFYRELFLRIILGRAVRRACQSASDRHFGSWRTANLRPENSVGTSYQPSQRVTLAAAGAPSCRLGQALGATQRTQVLRVECRVALNRLRARPGQATVSPVPIAAGNLTTFRSSLNFERELMAGGPAAAGQRTNPLPRERAAGGY